MWLECRCSFICFWEPHLPHSSMNMPDDFYVLSEFEDPSKNWAEQLLITLFWHFGESLCHCLTNPPSIHGELCKLPCISQDLILKHQCHYFQVLKIIFFSYEYFLLGFSSSTTVPEQDIWLRESIGTVKKNFDWVEIILNVKVDSLLIKYLRKDVILLAFPRCHLSYSPFSVLHYMCMTWNKSMIQQAFSLGSGGLFPPVEVC